DAAANGHVKYALASNRGRNPNQGDESIMNKATLLAFLLVSKAQFEFVRQSLVRAGAEGVTETSTEDQVAEAIHEKETLVAQSLQWLQESATAAPGQAQPAPAAPGQATAAVAAQAAAAQATPAPTQPEEIPFERLPRAMRESVITQAFAGSNLPEAVKQKIRK